MAPQATPTELKLQHLSMQDVIAIDMAIGQVARHRHGEVIIVIKDGIAKYVRPSPSLDIGRGVSIETGPL